MDITAFHRAHENTKIGSRLDWKRQGREAEYMRSSFFAPLEADSRAILAQCFTGRVVDDTPLPHTIWPNVYKSEKGVTHPCTFGEVGRYFTSRGEVVAKKGDGEVACPITNRDGHRCSDSTLVIYGYPMDCDEGGDESALLQFLNEIDAAYIWYQSGGWKPGKPKWHGLLPLAVPTNVEGVENRERWRYLYEQARIPLSSVARLLGEGLDPRISTPAQPIYLCERREPEAPPRKVIYRYGRAFDAHKIASLVPPLPTKVYSTPRVTSTGESIKRERAELVDLDDEKFEAIVSEIAKETSDIAKDRHPLYLGLSGALLDRGIDPDDMVEIITEVSSRYPRKNAECHRDNIRAALCTKAKFELGFDNYTRIGTVIKICPEAAFAIDRVLPKPEDELTKAIHASMQRWDEAATQPTTTPPQLPPSPPEPPKPPPEVQPTVTPPKPPPLPVVDWPKMRNHKKRGAANTPVARKLTRMAERLYAGGDVVGQFRAELVYRMLHALPFVVEEDPAWAKEYGVPRHMLEIMHLIGLECPEAGWFSDINNMVFDTICRNGPLTHYYDLADKYRAAFEAAREIRGIPPAKSLFDYPITGGK